MVNETDIKEVDHGAPGRVVVTVECGDGYNYVVSIDPEDGAVNIDHPNETASGGVFFTPKTWVAARDATDAAIRLWELSKGGHE